MRRNTLVAGTILAVAGAAALTDTARAGTAPNCTPGRVMILFDRSTSMHDDTIGGETKWSIATAAVSDIVAANQNAIEFGLDLFPAAALSCSGGTVVVQPALGTSSAITSGLTGPIPNMFTPIGQALTTAGNEASMNVTTRPQRAVILITDGHEDCPNAGDIEPRATIVAAATALKAKGITTYVVGFGAPSNGDGVDALTLNQLAVAGGTAIAGCDPTGASPTSPNLCYYQANDAAALSAALSAIAIHISAEIRDGLDNNCNGKVDEGLIEDCSTPCGPGTQTCTNGVWSWCTATMPAPEVCDGVDNNCNGVIDEGCDCVNGVTRSCGIDKGQCKPGTQTCTNGAWGDCEGGIGPTTEVCDGIDNDCDGVIDPGCDCKMGETRPCGGPDVGVCKSGLQTCAIDGTWGACIGAVGPTTEVCDGLDNNCNGTVDEPNTSENGTTTDLCGANATCTEGHCVMNTEAAVGRIAGGGLACAIGDHAAPGALAGMLILGLLLLIGRRRK